MVFDFLASLVNCFDAIIPIAGHDQVELFLTWCSR